MSQLQARQVPPPAAMSATASNSASASAVVSVSSSSWLSSIFSHPLAVASSIFAVCTFYFSVSRFRFRSRSVRPDINLKFTDPNISTSDISSIFECESREVFDKRFQILSRFLINEGDTVLDLGAGTGLFMEPLAKKVGNQGKLYSVDPIVRFYSVLQQKRSELPIELQSRISVIHSTFTSLTDSIVSNSVDTIICIDTYHHFEYIYEMLSEIHRVLKSNGTFIVIDFHRIEGKSTEWVMGHVRANRETVVQEITTSKLFKIKSEETWLEQNYFILFQKI